MFPWNCFLLSTQFAIHSGNSWRKSLLLPQPPPLLTKTGFCKADSSMNFYHSQQELHLHTHEASYFKLQWCQICCDTSDLWKGFWLSAILDYKEIRNQVKKKRELHKYITTKTCREDKPAPSKCNTKKWWEGMWVSHEIKPARFSKNIWRWSRINRKEGSCSSLSPSQN